MNFLLSRHTEVCIRTIALLEVMQVVIFAFGAISRSLQQFGSFLQHAYCAGKPARFSILSIRHQCNWLKTSLTPSKPAQHNVDTIHCKRTRSHLRQDGLSQNGLSRPPNSRRRSKKFYVRGEGQRNFVGESEGSLPPLHDSFPDAGEAMNDCWSMSGNFTHRHHVEPRVKLYSPRQESFPVPPHIQIWMSSMKKTSMMIGISMGQEICLIIGQVSLSLLC